MAPLGRVTASGVSSQNLEIQFEKPTPGLFTSHPRSQGKVHQCDPDAPGLCTQIWKLKQKPTARVGVVKSLEFSISDRAGTSRECSQNSENFFCPVHKASPSEPTGFGSPSLSPSLISSPLHGLGQQPETLGAGASCAHKLCGGKSGINAQEAVLASVLWKIRKSPNIHAKSGAMSHAQDCTGDCLRGRADCAGIRPEGRH